MKKADQLRLLNRLYRATQGFNGYDNIEAFGQYSLTNTGRLVFTSTKKTEVYPQHSIETEIHLIIGRIENSNP